MPGAHEHAHEATEHRENKRIALLIAVLALVLAFAETGAKSTQTEALSANIESANLWAFYQAKTIRMTSVRTAAEAEKLSLATIADPAARTAAEAQIRNWEQTAARYDSEPQTQEGRKELAARAQHAEEARELALARNHQFELSGAALQIGIVLASASVITGILMLAWLSGALGLVGLAFAALALFAPHALHFG